MKRLALLFQLIFVLLLLGGQSALSQSFPVQIVPQAIPPAPIYFSDYADESTVNSPLRVQVILNDLTISNREVRLKAYFEGNGISFQSNDLVTGSPLLFLEGGIPLTLTNSELAPYFKFENISGISPNVYGQPIPEGTYQFCFEIYDAATGNRLSNRSCAATVIFQNDPPILIAPQNRAIVEENNPQNIFFQWTPRHINVSNVEYELSIVEIWDNQVDHQAAFLSSPPIFTVTTTATTYFLGPADYTLLPDRNYAWRVQVKALQGTEEIGMFKNQGFSEIFVFGNTDKCDLPLGIAHEVKGATNATILWNDFTTETPEFTVRYRQKGNTGEWFYSKTTANLVTLWDLKAGTEYEYQVAKKCALSESEYSVLDTFRTNLFDDDDSTYECGISPNIDVTNIVPLDNLEVGEQFTAGDFPVTVLEVNGSNGYFNGKGYVTIPYLKSIKVAVEFTNIFINQKKELAQGNVMTMYDPTLSGIVDPWDWADDVDDIINGGDHTTYPSVDFEIESVTISEDKNEITLNGTDENGNPVSVTYGYDEGDTYTVQGGDKVYSINENGNLSEIGNVAEGGPVNDTNTAGVQEGGDGTAESPSVASIDDTLVAFEYVQDTSASFGWDSANSPYEKDNYPNVPLQSGATFYPIHKAVKNGSTDTFYVDVDLKSEDISLDQLIFKTISGLAIDTEVVSGTNRIKVTVKGVTGYRSEEAVITYKESEERQVVVSSFFIHHLGTTNQANVTLIPVNGYQIPTSIQTEVAAKFKAAGASLNIIEGANFNGNASGVQYTESGLLERLPDGFNNFASDFKANSGNYSNENYYVFVFDENVRPGNNLAGFMPRGSQFGFVFPSNIGTTGLESKRTTADVVAHEIGHGVYGMSHPADNDLGTDWVMDKGNGDQFAKRDWEAIGDRGLKFYLFDDDEDGAYTNIEFLNKVIQKFACAAATGNQDLESGAFGPEETFRIKTQELGVLRFKIRSKVTTTKRVQVKREWYQRGVTNFHYYSLDYGGLYFYKFPKEGGFSSTIPEEKLISDLNEFQDYLFSVTDETAMESIADDVLNQIKDKTSYDDNDIRALKRIANCAARKFTVEEKYRIIRILAFNEKKLSETYEDLIFDLIENFEGNREEYATNFINQFDNDVDQGNLMQRFFKHTQNSGITTLWQGNEQNYDRWLDVFYNLWADSEYVNPAKFEYLEEAENDNLEISPSTVVYAGHKWFPKTTYSNFQFEKSNIKIDKVRQILVAASTSGAIYDTERLRLNYSYFQPVLVYLEDENKTDVLTGFYPAIYFVGDIKRDNVKKNLQKAELVFDVVTTLTGVGNLAKLRHLKHLKHLSRLAKAKKVTIATVPFTIDVADIILKHTELCELSGGDKEFCQALESYNSYLQVALLSVGAVRGTLKLSRDRAAKQYQRKRAKLVKELGEEHKVIKELDAHFASKIPVSDAKSILANAGASSKILAKLDNWHPDLLNKLEDSLKKYPDLAKELVEDIRLLDHFENMHTIWYYRIGLARAYKVKNTSNGSVDLPDNFGNVLKDLDLPDNLTVRDLLKLSASDASSKLGKILESKLDEILETAWAGGRKGIAKADLPEALKDYYLSIYDKGYTVMSKQVKIKVPNAGNPEPDYLFFKTKDSGKKLDLDDILYHDSKISIYSDLSKAQKEIKKLIESATGQGKASFQVHEGKIGDFILEEDGLITIKEISKIATELDSEGIIDLVRKLVVENPD